MNPSSENPASIPVYVATTAAVQFERLGGHPYFSTNSGNCPITSLSQATCLLEGAKEIIQDSAPDGISPRDYTLVSVLEMVSALIDSVVIKDEEGRAV